MQVIEVGDAFARSNADGTSWTVGTEAVEVTYTAREGLFALTGFSNKLTSPPTLYRPRAPLAPEPAGNGPWRLREAATSTTTVGGQRAALLTLRLMHHDLAVCLRVIAYPGTAVLRQWLELENTATSPLAPEPTVFTMEIADDGTAPFTHLWMVGGNSKDDQGMLQSAPVSGDYRGEGRGPGDP